MATWAILSMAMPSLWMGFTMEPEEIASELGYPTGWIFLHRSAIDLAAPPIRMWPSTEPAMKWTFAMVTTDPWPLSEAWESHWSREPIPTSFIIGLWSTKWWLPDLPTGMRELVVSIFFKNINLKKIVYKIIFPYSSPIFETNSTSWQLQWCLPIYCD